MAKDTSKNWFSRHKILTVLLALFAIGVIGSAVGGDSSPQSTKKSETTPAASTQTTPKPQLDLAAFYGQVQTGMTKDEVVTLAANDAGQCTASEIQGLGSSEYCSWYGSFGSSGYVAVTFQDGKVSSKSKSGF